MVEWLGRSSPGSMDSGSTKVTRRPQINGERHFTDEHYSADENFEENLIRLLVTRATSYFNTKNPIRLDH
jgi:hypothetical protein